MAGIAAGSTSDCSLYMTRLGGLMSFLLKSVYSSTLDIDTAPNNILLHRVSHIHHNQGPEKDASTIHYCSRRPPPAPLPNYLCCCDATIETGSTGYETGLQIRGTHNCGGQGTRLQYGGVYG